MKMRRRPNLRRKTRSKPVDILGMMKKAQQVQAKMAEIQSELENTLVDGEAGNGAVRVQMTGKGDLTKLEVSDDLLSPTEKDMLQDLILLAHADARRKAGELAGELMKSATEGIPLPPGLKLPF
jgi:DNA-binding YbaB/EbfC family protein